MRCVDAQGRILLPGQFIPVMEQTGMIREAGDWALGAACRQIRAWLDEQATHADPPAGTPPPLAINLSAVQLDDATLPDRIAELLDRYRLAPARLALEVTETALMDKADRARTILERLTTLGVSLHLDDFGTGYSSLALLGELPFSVIKIDRSFVRQVPGSEKHVGLIAAMIAMAHHLHLRVVAEGVENPDQWALLRQLGCDMAQGYLISRPLPPAAFAQLCMGHRDRPVKHG
jgi:EAL domain-containing protein (putative c-di-GMP-specific phosphodiesterase class I)